MGIIFSLGCIIILLVLLPLHDLWYPKGWDAGYYISRVQYYIAGEIKISDSGMLRSGYILLSALLVKVTGISARSMEIILPGALLIGLSGMAGGIVKSITKSWAIAITTVFIHLFFPNYLRFTQSLSANLLALLILYIIIFCIIKYFYKPKVVVPAIVLGTFLIAITHIETLFFTLIFFLIAGILIVAGTPITKKRIYSAIYFFTIPLFAVIVTLFFAPRSGSIQGLLQMYFGSNNLSYSGSSFITNLLASHPPAALWAGMNSSLHYNAVDIVSVMGLGGFLILIYTFARYKTVWAGLLLSFCLSVMLVSALTYGQESFVYQRVNLLWPLPMLATLLYAIVSRILHPSQKIILTMALLITIFSRGVLTARSYYLFIPPESVSQTEHLGMVLQQYPQVSQWDILVFVNDDVVSNAPTYRLWADNIAAILPPNLGSKICIYGTTYEEYLAAKTKHNNTLLYSLDPITRDTCLRSPSSHVAIIQSFYVPWVENKNYTELGMRKISTDSQVQIVVPEKESGFESRQ